MRINARLNDARLATELTPTTGRSVSHVVREAIAAYHAQLIAPRRPSRFLALAGKGRSGGSDTASNINALLTEALEQKLALQPRAVPPQRRP